MKHLIILLFILLSQFSLACKCITQPLSKYYVNADFVAKIKVLKIYENEIDNDFFKIDILIENLYKGTNIKSIMVYGLSKDGQTSACHIVLEENENILVYGKKSNGIEEYHLETCSRVIKLDSQNLTNFKKSYNDRELEILDQLKSSKIDFKGIVYEYNSRDLSAFLRRIGEVELQENFSIYEIYFNKQFDITCVKKIKGFKNKKINRKVKRFLKRKKEISIRNIKKSEITDKNKHLIIIYHVKRVGSKKGPLSARFKV